MGGMCKGKHGITWFRASSHWVNPCSLTLPNDVSSPSPPEHPNLPSFVTSNGGVIFDGVQPIGGLTGSAYPLVHHVMGVSQAAMWHQLQIVGAKVDRWQFVAEYDDLPTTIWELWQHHNSAQTAHIFRDTVRGAIAEGEGYIQMLIDILPTQVGMDMDFKPWGIEVVELLSKVHRAIAALKIRLEMVEMGLVHRHPKVLCPRQLDH